MSRGRPPNPHRAGARLLGQRTYRDAAPCIICGTDERYVSNGNCVSCSIARGKHRYANLTDEQKTSWKERDHDRYMRRLNQEERRLYHERRMTPK